MHLREGCINDLKANTHELKTPKLLHARLHADQLHNNTDVENASDPLREIVTPAHPCVPESLFQTHLLDFLSLSRVAEARACAGLFDGNTDSLFINHSRS